MSGSAEPAGARRSYRWCIRRVMRRWISGKAVGVIGGVRQKIHFLCMDLPQSDACFVEAYGKVARECVRDGVDHPR